MSIEMRFKLYLQNLMCAGEFAEAGQQQLFCDSLKPGLKSCH